MEKKVIRKAIRMHARLVKEIERTAQSDGSTFSQFIRMAAIRELNRRKAA